MGNLIGQSLGRYHILEQLGEGGMAIVYKAYDTRLESEVAIKFIRMERLAPENVEKALKRFAREAKALAKLTHPNIVKVTDYGEYEGRPYLVMPYLSGGTLKQLHKGSPMDWRQAARLLLPIAEALDYAHKQGVLHRDIKSSNILITDSGAPMLADFGVARLFEAEETSDLTGTGVGIGTPEYMAPEQGRGKTDQRSEVYSLGVVLYELVTGRRPYTADTPLAVLLMQATDPLPPPHKFVSHLPANVERMLFKALAKDPDARYQSMREFADALERIAGVGEAGSSRKRRAVTQFSIVSVIILMLIIGGIFTVRSRNNVVLLNSWGNSNQLSMQPSSTAPETTSAPTVTTPLALKNCNSDPEAKNVLEVAQHQMDLIIPAAKVIWFDDFSCSYFGSRWSVQRDGARTQINISDGLAKISAELSDNTWDRIYRSKSLVDGRGILTLFRFESGMIGSLYLEAGTWDTASYRSLSLNLAEVHGEPFESQWFYWIGTQTGAEDFRLALQPGEWYYLLLSVDNNQILARVWSKANPGNFAETAMDLNDGYDWRFAAESHDGAVELDEYYELQFGESQ